MKKVITVLVIVCSTLSLFAQNENKLENSKGTQALPAADYWQLYNGSIFSKYKVGIKTNSPSKDLTIQGDFLVEDGRDYYNIFSDIRNGKIYLQGLGPQYELGYNFKGFNGNNFGGLNVYAGFDNLSYFYIGQDWQNNIMKLFPSGDVEVKEKLKAKTIEASNYIGSATFNGYLNANTIEANGDIIGNGSLTIYDNAYVDGNTIFGGNVSYNKSIITDLIVERKAFISSKGGGNGDFGGIEFVGYDGVNYGGWKAYGQGNVDYFYVGGLYQQPLMYLKTDGKVQIGSQSQSADVKVKGNLGIYTPGDNKIELADNPEGFMQINKVDNDLGLPTASTYGNIFQKFESSNATLEMGLSQNGTTWLLTRAKDFLNQNAGMHIQPKVDGNTSYRGVGIGFNPSELIPVDTYLAVNGKVGIGTLTPTTELEVNGTIKATTIEATEIIGVTMSQWNFENNNLTFTQGNVGIGTETPSEMLTVNGNILSTTLNAGITKLLSNKVIVDGTIYAKEIQVLDPVPQSDYVFESDYKLRTLEEVEQFVKTNKHLPEVPSAADFKENGYSIGQMDDILLRKVEELTLYMIELKKENQALKAQNEAIQEKLESITK